MYNQTRPKNRFAGNSGRNKTRDYGSRDPYFISKPARSDSRRNSFAPKKRRGFSENIDVSKFVKAADMRVENAVEITHSFADFTLVPTIQKNLAGKGYTIPTPIQDQALSHILAGRDLIGLANTGTGKTAAFLLPMINKVYHDRTQKVIIIAPTRELALQIENEFRQFSWSMGIFSASCVGGMPIFKQIQNLRRNPNFVIGTPGRIKDLSDRGMIKYETFNNVILDEVDRMLDMGFIDEIKDILEKLAPERQSLFFSATMPPKIRELVTKFSKDAVTVSVSQGETAGNVDQDIVRVRDKAYKFNQLAELLGGTEFKKVLIFIETKRDVDKLTSNLNGEGFRAIAIHGDKRQRERQRALAQFKDCSVNIMVATDVAARGLDIKDITHVINYTLPQTYNDYIHRIGRTGRGTSTGKALTFVE